MKTCSKCRRELPAEAFHKNRKRGDGLQSQCKSCKSDTDKRDYAFNGRKDECTARRTAQRILLRSHIEDYLSKHNCVDCGNSDRRVLEFDHVRDTKRYNVSDMPGFGVALETLHKEISKCDVRCANCHRIKTWETLWEVDKLAKSSASEAEVL